MAMTTDAATVLVVDDEPDVCWVLDRITRAAGERTVTTASGRQALQLAREGHFRLAFVDAKLPDGEGLELARRLRELAPALRIVVISGYFFGDDADVSEALNAGVVDRFVSKPFLHDDIRAIVRATQRA